MLKNGECLRGGHAAHSTLSLSNTCRCRRRRRQSKLAEAQAVVIETEVARQQRAESAEAKDRELREAKAQLQHLLQAITGGDASEEAFAAVGPSLPTLSCFTTHL